MSAAFIRMVTQYRPQQRFLEAIFLPEREQGLVRVGSTITTSSALATAEYSLLMDPLVPVALVLDCGGVDPLRDGDIRATNRVLDRAALPESPWVAAFADPGVESWALADPRVRDAVGADGTSIGERSERVADLAKARPIDREAIRAAHPEFRDLDDFVAAQVRSLAAAV